MTDVLDESARGPATGHGALVRRPVIFLAAEHGFEARYLFRSGILDALREALCVLLVPNADEAYMRNELGSERVVIETLDLEALQAFTAQRFAHRFLSLVRAFTLGGGAFETVDDKLTRYRERSPRRDLLRRTVVTGCVRLLRRSARARAALVRWESRRLAPNLHGALFERYRPDLVVVPGPGFMLADTFLLREARARGVRTVAVVASWDNTTSRGLAGAVADNYVAWTDIMKDELVTGHDVPAEHIHVGGIAHFEVYRLPPSPARRGELIKQLDLVEGRKVIVFGATSLEDFPNADIVRILGEAVAAERFSSPCQIVVRVHPIALRGSGRGAAKLDGELLELQRLASGFPHVHLNIPVVRSTKLRVDLHPAETDLLGELLKLADVVVNVFSTLNIEAALCDAPIVNVAFNGYADRVRDPYLSAIKAGDRAHNRRISSYGATRIVRTPEELLSIIDSYLKDPSMDAEGRRRLVDAEVGHPEEPPARRIGNHLLDLARGATR